MASTHRLPPIDTSSSGVRVDDHAHLIDAAADPPRDGDFRGDALQAWAHGKGRPSTPESLNWARHALPYYALWKGQPLKRPYGGFRGEPPAGRAACNCFFLPPWTPHAIRLCV
jgi:hypothetical protein